ncbi:PPC domain-containing protein [Tundrisphaera lichenicola]|uniref:PPC domain-containing protein n=1 Tax=Tundrisphaera lichenicola TaxID=2029860 RepID=UPI003EBB8AF3
MTTIGPRSSRIDRHSISTPILLLAFASIASAKAPTLETLFPAGAARGSAVEVTAGGNFERWPVRAWTSKPGLTIKFGEEKGKLSIEVAPDAPTGVHWVRLFDDEGATAPRPFFVGVLPEWNEVEPNDEVGQAQKIDLPDLIVNGRLAKRGDVDGYRVHLAKGQTLVASMEAHRRLGSPMDGVLQVASSAGFVLAQNDDEHERDPQIAFEAPSDGDYIVRAFAFPFVQASTIRFDGESTYVYRLTLATGGVVDHSFPLAISESGPSEVEATGWNIPEGARRLPVEPPGLEASTPIRLHHAGLANEAEVLVVRPPSIIEAEPNDFDHPQPVNLPVAISGRLDPPRDVDAYAFEARKGAILNFRVEARSIGQMVDAVLRISDASGKMIIEEDDNGRRDFDPEVRFTAPADGTFRVTVRDLNGQGGPRHAYLLVAESPRADFALTLKGDQFPLTPGKPTEVEVAVDRQEGFAEPIEIGLEGHYDGVISSPVVSLPEGPTAKSVTLKLEPCDCAKTGPIRIVGTSREGLRKFATTAGLDTAWLSVPKPEPPAEKKPEPAK